MPGRDARGLRAEKYARTLTLPKLRQIRQDLLNDDGTEPSEDPSRSRDERHRAINLRHIDRKIEQAEERQARREQEEADLADASPLELADRVRSRW